MEMKEEIVIVGAGIAGLTASLGLWRLGLRCLVLESSDSLRTTGFAITLWTNAWRALDAVGIADSLRQHSSELLLETNRKHGDYECRCVRRKELLEVLEKELPHGTIRYSSKVVSIEESGHFKLVHLADGSIIRTKVLIGCDEVNSLVAKWLGLHKPVSVRSSAIRGFVDFPDGHGFEPKPFVYFVGAVRFGFLPVSEKSLYWYCTFNRSVVQYGEGMEESPLRMKQFVLSRIGNVPKEAFGVVERTELEYISCAPLKMRLPWNVLLGNIAKQNVCVAGDALHPMTPELGQGGSSALEDSVILARCLAETFSTKPRGEIRDEEYEEEEYERINKGLMKYMRERRWRSFSLISTAYVVGFIQESDGMVMKFVREKLFSKYTAGILLRMADFECGKLVIS